MLEITEREIKNGQSRKYWQHWAHKTHDADKQNNKKHNTTQKTRKMSNTDPTNNLGVNPGASEGKK